MPPIPTLPDKQSIISQLTGEPLNFPEALAKALAEGFPDICYELLSINFRSLREQDRPKIESLDQRITKYLLDSKRRRLIAIWLPVRNRLLDFCEFGVTGPVETIAAMILAGGAMNHTKRAKTKTYQLRDDLDLTLKTECANKTSLHPFEESYKKFTLVANQPDTSLLSQKIKKILAKESVPLIKLRLGKELSTLNLNEIEKYREKFFMQPQTFSRWGNRKGSLKGILDISTPPLYAPKKVEIKLVNAHCDQQQQPNRDKVFWMIYFSQLANLQNIYQQIDQAIKTGSLQTVNLDLQMKVTTQLTNKYLFTTGQDKMLNFPAGNVNLIQGFGPWHCDMVCYGDKNNLVYGDIKEAYNGIGDYVSAIHRGAQNVVSVSSPTVLAAGATVVASAAKEVEICAEVGSAITKIANLFDKDDYYLGSKSFDGKTDYVMTAPEENPFPDADLGSYTIRVVEYGSGVDTVTRNWEVISTSGEGEKQEIGSISIILPGIPQDRSVKFDMNADTHKIVDSGVTPVCIAGDNRGDMGQGKWIKGPSLDKNMRTITGIVQISQKGSGYSIEFTPWVQGIRLLAPPL